MRAHDGAVRIARFTYRYFEVREELRKDQYQLLTDLCESDQWDKAEALVAALEVQEEALAVVERQAEELRIKAEANNTATSVFGGTHQGRVR